MLNIAKTPAVMGKLSNNIEHHGDEDVNAFDLPLSEIQLSQEQVNELLDDPYACRALYNDTRTGDVEPAIAIMNPHPLHETFDGAVVAFSIGNLEFSLQDCKISKVELTLQRGGVSKLAFTMRVRPEKDKQILAFLGHQNREISIDVQDAKIAVKGGRKQPELFDAPEPGAGGTPPIDGRAPASDEQIGRAQSEALANSTAATPAEQKAAKKGRGRNSGATAH